MSKKGQAKEEKSKGKGNGSVTFTEEEWGKVLDDLWGIESTLTLLKEATDNECGSLGGGEACLLFGNSLGLLKRKMHEVVSFLCARDAGDA
jgi:hypothetical protein